MFLIADEHTYAAAGNDVYKILERSGIAILSYIYSEEKCLSSTARGNVGCTNLGTQGGNQHDKVGIGQCFEIFSLSYQEKFT